MLRFFCVILLSFMTLTGCSLAPQAPTSTIEANQLEGAWSANNQKSSMVLQANGALTFFSNKDEIGMAWEEDNATLLLHTLVNGAKTTSSYTIESLTPHSLTLRQANNVTTYQRDDASFGVVDGSLFYRERMALPPQALAVITLQDVSRADAPAITIAQTAIRHANYTPLMFTLPYPKDAIIPNHTYAMRAEIFVDGERMFMNTQSYQVLTHGNSHTVDILLHRVMPTMPESTSIATLTNTYWKLKTLEGSPVTFIDGAKSEAHLILKDDGATAGSDGCNRFFGSYTTKEQSLHILLGGSTMMLCPNGEQSAAFMKALHEATGYRIAGNELTLRSNGKASATFVAQPLQ